ncbi:MAG: hypothetical protein ACOYNI_00610 [Acidimicrobiia bacterium]
MTRLRVVVWSAGGPDIGIGHLARASAVTNALVAAGAEVHAVQETPATIAPRARSHRAPTTPVAPGSGLDAVIAALEIPATVVTDHPLVNAQTEAALRAAGALALVHLTHSGADTYAADLLIDGDPIIVPFTNVAHRTVQGAQYLALAPHVLAKRPSAPWAGTGADRLLVILGGADPDAFTERLLASQTAALRDATFVAGPAWSEERTAALVQTAPGRVLVAPESTEAVEAMLHHDLIVTLGGITSFEAMALGRPCAAVEWSHMRPYVDSLGRAGLLANLGTIDDAPAALDALTHDGPRLRSLAEQGFTTFDGRGAHRVADVVLGLTNERLVSCAS